MLDLIRSLAIDNTTKIVLLSLDGLGGLPRPETGKSELETARMPNLSALASAAACGLLRHVAPGITPGSGPGHLGLFGYDPLAYQVGRGVLESLGIEFDLRAAATSPPAATSAPSTAAASSPTGAPGASRPSVCVRLTDRLRTIRLPGVEVLVEPVKEHRFVLVLRGAGLSGRLTRDGSAGARQAAAAGAARSSRPRPAPPSWSTRSSSEARRRLADAAPANMVLLRGFDQLAGAAALPRGLRRCGRRPIAAYPMYRGLAKLVGMDVIKTGATFADEIATLREHWQAYDFFFVHYKDTDKAGEDGKFDAKVEALERFDAFIPAVRALGPDVLVVTGDHATPSILAAHGWQPVPVLVWSRYCGADPVTPSPSAPARPARWECMPAHHLMPLVMANALRLTKFGA